MLIVTGYMNVDPSDLTQFYAELRTLADATRRRSGNISYDAAMDEPRYGRLLVVERWKDQAALSDHLAAADTADFVRRWRGRMQGNILKYDACNERDLLGA